jgi:xanthine dehydrogenase small subunit
MTKPIRFMLNDRKEETAGSTGGSALDYIRRTLRLTGTREGCREGECGACTVLLGEPWKGTVRYKAVASCLLPLGELEGRHIVTVEGINRSDGKPNTIQQALVEEGAVQCGFCTPGIVMSLTGFFLTVENPTFQEAVDALDGNICRCTGYKSIQRALRNLCDTYGTRIAQFKKEQQEADSQETNQKESRQWQADRIHLLVEWNILPAYFKDIAPQLSEIGDTGIDAQVSDKERRQKKRKNRVVVAGATDLLVQQPEELKEQELYFISRRDELRQIRQKDNWLFIGAGVTVEEMKRSPEIEAYYPRMPEYLSLVSSTIMRNRATLAGNIVNASPIGDLTIMLLAMDADICLVDGKQRREMPLRDFYKGYKTLDRRKSEIIESVEIPLPRKEWDIRFNFEKVSRRKYLDIASINTAMSIRMDEERIETFHLSAGGVAPVPLYLKDTCANLKGRKVDRETIDYAFKVIDGEISPITDVRGSAQYKRKLLRNLVYSHFLTMFPEKNFDPNYLLSLP